MRAGWMIAAAVLMVSCGDGSPASDGSSETSATTESADTTSSSSAGTTGTPTSSTESTSTTAAETGTTTGTPVGPVAACFEDAFVNDPELGPDYDQFMLEVGSHCLGTNHQDIDGIERVVFLGDSVTVGTPPSLSAQYYRSRLADAVAAEFGLSFGGSEFLWKTVNIFNGQSTLQDAGDFSSCARWGARNDDLLQDNTQIEDCFPPATRDLRTLVVMTSGGNDLQALSQSAIDGASEDELWAQAMGMVQLQREAIEWFVSEPDKFPSGVFVVFGNLYEFTDGTGDVESCDVSGLAGFDQPLPAPDLVAEMVIWVEEQYGKIAVETGTDMIFMLEHFCGHGFHHDDPMAPCYRGPDTEQWFDLTCIHPNPTGHQQIADMFMAVVQE